MLGRSTLTVEKLLSLKAGDMIPCDFEGDVTLFAEGIGCSVHYIPLHLHPYWRDRYHLQAAQFPHSQHAFERLVSLPIYTRMTDADVERVIAAVHRVLGR